MSDTVTSAQVREQLRETLELDLIGPYNDHPAANEVLPENPLRWYLTGFLAPGKADTHHRRSNDTLGDEDGQPQPPGYEDDTQAEKAATRRTLFPSAIGLSTIVPEETTSLEVTAEWGEYEEHEIEEDTASTENSDEQNESLDEERRRYRYHRIPKTRVAIIPVPVDDRHHRHDLPDASGVEICVMAKKMSRGLIEGISGDARIVSIWLVNGKGNPPKKDGSPFPAFLFQSRLAVRSTEGFLARPDPRKSDLTEDWDRRVADLQYRNVFEFAVGSGCAAESLEIDRTVAPPRATHIRTAWMPGAYVPRVEPVALDGVTLGMEELGALETPDAAEKALSGLISQYRNWIVGLNDTDLSDKRRDTLAELKRNAEASAGRMAKGLAFLRDPNAFEAFKLANRAVAASYRQRNNPTNPMQVDAPKWRPFQLAFLLQTIPGMVGAGNEENHHERKIVDLLFFPTGGGKTEAYLGLSAFTMAYRRLSRRDADGAIGIGGAGVSVLMRYTLRLLTLDQLGRAAGLVCALELERLRHPEQYGSYPFEIGLWVGSAATPNKMGDPGDEYGAVAKIRQHQRNSKRFPPPVPITVCPWCGQNLTPESYQEVGRVDPEHTMAIICPNHACPFSGAGMAKQLPVLAVDEAIYRRLPAFIISTVDKFAMLPWLADVGSLFGKVDRVYRPKNSSVSLFIGPGHPRAAEGMPLDGGSLPPPDLIIQDELHLISGPLGTVAGLYEAAIEKLCTSPDGRAPKIIASTATIRRAQAQICALFNRSRVEVFPPPGLDIDDSFFAKVDANPDVSRLYLGVAAQGRGQKVGLLRVMLALLSAGMKEWENGGGNTVRNNQADPYMTLMTYFNSLRELGGARRIVEDEIYSRLPSLSRRRRVSPDLDILADRSILYEPTELNSRVSTAEVAEARQHLALPYRPGDKAKRVDIALATNMISVGLDVTRLGLMAVHGQPKTMSEYIQATSRVGRDRNKPGLIITLMNVHRPRDRSHYEHFMIVHEAFYREVEAASVTPFSARARDRSLAAALVGLCRHYIPKLTPSDGSMELASVRNGNTIQELIRMLVDRAGGHRKCEPMEEQRLREEVRQEIDNLLDSWVRLADEEYQVGGKLHYQSSETERGRAVLIHEWLETDYPEKFLPFRMARSMRDVEPGVELDIQRTRS